MFFFLYTAMLSNMTLQELSIAGNKILDKGKCFQNSLVEKNI